MEHGARRVIQLDAGCLRRLHLFWRRKRCSPLLSGETGRKIYEERLSPDAEIYASLVAADGKVFCLIEAPNKEAAATVHREAHGLEADEIIEVQEGE